MGRGGEPVNDAAHVLRGVVGRVLIPTYLDTTMNNTPPIVFVEGTELSHARPGRNGESEMTMLLFEHSIDVFVCSGASPNVSNMPKQ